jgi:hypothetical protein
MVEYAGIIPLKPVDWGKIAQDAAKPITDVIQEREDQRKGLEKDKSESLSLLQKYEQNKAPNGAQFIMNASQEGRSYVMAQYELLTSGQITPEEYKRNTQNTRESFSMLNTYMKTYEADIQKAQDRIDSGEAGKMERYLTDYRSQIMDLSGKVSNFGNNGSMYITGEDGRIYDLQSLNMGINKQPMKVDVIAEVDRAVKGLGVGGKMVDGKYTISQKLMGDWKKTQKNIENAIMDNPNKIASILADNSDEEYRFTFDPKEAGGLNILIETDPNGIMVAKITPEQRSEAAKVLKTAIEGRVSEETKEVDNTKAWALSNETRRIKLEEREQAFKETQAALPIQTRVNTIARMLETGDIGPIVGAGLQGIQERGEVVTDEDGNVVGDVQKAYAGYDIFSIEPSEGGKGYNITLSAKQADESTGKKSIVKKKIYMPTSGVITSFNNALSSTASSDEYKGISPEQVLPYFQSIIQSSKKTTKKAANQAP